MSNNELVDLPINKLVAKMVIPASLGMLITFVFQVVDTYFIGKLGSRELAAISFAYPVYFLIVAIVMGVASGVSSVVGKALGENNHEKARAVVMGSLIVFILIAAAVGILGTHSIALVFKSMGASYEMIGYVSDYMEIIYLGMVLLVGTLIANSALIAKGKMKSTTLIMAIGGVINIALDYLLIFGFDWGVVSVSGMGLRGAALATVISWGATFVLMLYLLQINDLLKLSEILSDFKQLKDVQEVVVINSSTVTAQVITPLSVIVLTRIVSGFGEHAVAAFGIIARIESLGLTGVLALSVILTPIVAQNYGAKKMERIKAILWYCAKFVLYWSLGLYIILVFFSHEIAGIFTGEPQIINSVKHYIHIVGISFSLFGFTLFTSSYLNGIYRPNESIKLTITKALLLTVPLSLLGSAFGLNYIWLGIAMANLLGAIYAKRLQTNTLNQLTSTRSTYESSRQTPINSQSRESFPN